MSTREGDGFSRFVAISIAAHAGILAALLAFVFLARPKEEPVASFELVGVPGLPPGSAGAPEGGSASAAEEGSSSVAPADSKPPEESSEPSMVPAEKAATASKSQVHQPLKPPGRSDANAGTSKTPGKTSANAGRGSGTGKGFLNGKGGSGTDTIEVGNGGGGGGAPSYMSSWLTRVRTLVERQWRNVPASWGTPKGAPVVVFAISRDGRSGRPELVHASGNPMVDRMALRAIQAVDAFPPPPQAWPKEEVKLRYVLEVNSP